MAADRCSTGQQHARVASGDSAGIEVVAEMTPAFNQIWVYLAESPLLGLTCLHISFSLLCGGVAIAAAMIVAWALGASPATVLSIA